MCRNSVLQLTNWCLDGAPTKPFGCRCSSPYIWDMPCGRPSLSRCERNHNQNTVQLGCSCYQFSPAAQGDCCLRYLHHCYLFRSPPNHNDMEMSVVNLRAKMNTRRWELMSFHICSDVLRFPHDRLVPIKFLHSEFSIQNRISNEVNRLRSKDSTMTFSRDNLKTNCATLNLEREQETGEH